MEKLRQYMRFRRLFEFKSFAAAGVSMRSFRITKLPIQHEQNQHSERLSKFPRVLIPIAAAAIWTAEGDDDNALFLMAVADGDESLMKHYLEKENIDINTKDSNGLTALIQASLAGNYRLVSILLSKGADVNAGPKAGITALIAATEKAHDSIVRLLLAHGADVNARDEKCRHSCTALHYAVFHGHEKIARMLIQHKADINAQNDNGATPLMLATVQGDFACVKLLCDKNANVDLPETRENVTPLMIACYEGNYDIARLLIANGANVNLRNNHGATSLIIAASSPSINPDVIELLLKKGADIHARDKGGMTALLFATQSGCQKALTLLSAAQKACVENNARHFQPSMPERHSIA